MTRGLIVALAVTLMLSGSPLLAQDHDHDGDHEGDAAVVGVGTVNAVDAAARKINLTHDPIPAIGWPSMTMDMNLSDHVDPAELEVGAEVRFT